MFSRNPSYVFRGVFPVSWRGWLRRVRRPRRRFRSPPSLRYGAWFRRDGGAAAAGAHGGDAAPRDASGVSAPDVSVRGARGVGPERCDVRARAARRLPDADGERRKPSCRESRMRGPRPALFWQSCSWHTFTFFFGVLRKVFSRLHKARRATAQNLTGADGKIFSRAGRVRRPNGRRRAKRRRRTRFRRRPPWRSRRSNRTP